MTAVHAITVHHRGPEILSECLNSLLESRGVDLRVVVVANGRDAELPEIRSGSPVSVVRREDPLGFSAANNLGVQWARRELGEADFYYFVNNDVVTEVDALQRLVASLHTSPRARVVGPLLLIEWARGSLNSLGLNVTEDAWGWDEGIGVSLEEYGPLPGRRSVLAITGSALLIEARAYRTVGGWTDLYDYYFEDIDLCLKVRRRGWDVIHEPEAVAYHHISASVGLDSEYKHYLFLRNRLLLALAHWPPRLLFAVLKRAIGDEILANRWQDVLPQRIALAGAVRRLPRALLRRLRVRGREWGWTRFLRPVGSVPVITLPEKGQSNPDTTGHGRDGVSQRRMPANPGEPHGGGTGMAMAGRVEE